MLTPNPTNECNSTLTSGTRGIYPHCYTLMLMSGVTGYEFATRGGALLEFPIRTVMHRKSRVSSAISVCDS